MTFVYLTLRIGRNDTDVGRDDPGPQIPGQIENAFGALDRSRIFRAPGKSAAKIAAQGAIDKPWASTSSLNSRRFGPSICSGDMLPCVA